MKNGEDGSREGCCGGHCAGKVLNVVCAPRESPPWWSVVSAIVKERVTTGNGENSKQVPFGSTVSGHSTFCSLSSMVDASERATQHQKYSYYYTEFDVLEYDIK